MSSISILSLPNEVILMIMDNLSIYDKMAFSMTCRNFLTLFNSTPKLNKDKLIQINRGTNDLFFALFTERKLRNLPRSIIPHLQFINCKNIAYNKKFWNLYGKFVLSISFECCVFSGDDNFLKQIIANCPKLEKLETECNEWISAINKVSELKLGNLKSVNVSTELSDYSLNNFINNAPNLKHVGTLSVSEFVKRKTQGQETFKCNKRSRIEIGKNIIPINEDINMHRLTKNNLLAVLPLSKINSLHLEDREDSINIIEDICELKKSGFKLEAISGVQISCPFKLLGKTFQDSLKRVEISNDYDDLEHLDGLDKLINLETLKWSTYNFTSERFKKIESLKNLEELELYNHCCSNGDILDPDLEHDALYLFNLLVKLPKLQRLIIKNCLLPDIHDGLTNVKLTELHLENCHIEMHKVVISICNGQKLLQKLNLSSCYDINTNNEDIVNFCSDEFHDGIDSLKYLKSLSLEGLNGIDVGVIGEFEWKELTILKLMNSNITDAELLNLSKNCLGLTELDISKTSITDKGLKYLSNLPRLRKIDLWGTRITEVGIKYLIKYCPLSYCNVDGTMSFKFKLCDLAGKYNRIITFPYCEWDGLSKVILT